MIQENLPIYTQIIEKAFAMINLPTTEPLIEAFAKMNLEEKTQELLTSRVLAHKENNLPTVFIRFVEDGTPLVEAIFYPYLAVDSFWDEVQKFYINAKLSKEELEEKMISECVYLTVILFNTMRERMTISISWLTNEVINEWYARVREYNVQLGYAIPKSEITKTKKQTFQGHNKDIENYWNHKEESWLNEQYSKLAREYPKILEHWQALGNLSRHFERRDNTIDGHAWRRYAKPVEYADTPDDLLNELELMNSKDVWKLAIEHAARRVGLFKVDGVKEEILEKRKQGIMKTGYDSNYLLGFVNKGEKFLVKIKSENHLNAKPK
ncbi:MAG: hypothetical protein M3388_17390 [Acidobacteriota bacterium]|nr:hypothetical protein [Acidobacteriota bacterium]